MTSQMMLVLVGVSVALVSFIVYALERRSKSEKIIWEDALKLALFGGIVSSGVVFASTTDGVKETIAAIDIPNVQDMFVGTPAF
jgi:hypothetical protein